jgi:hypothetical protein
VFIAIVCAFVLIVNNVQGVTAMSDFREIYKADFELVNYQKNENETTQLVLRCVKPSRLMSPALGPYEPAFAALSQVTNLMEVFPQMVVDNHAHMTRVRRQAEAAVVTVALGL